MRRRRIGVGGRRIGFSVVALALGGCLALAGIGSAAAPRRDATAAVATSAASSFVSLYPLGEPSEIDRYALAGGRQLGVLAHIPPVKSTATSSAVSTPHLLATGDYLLTLDHGDVCQSAHGACHAVRNSCSSRVETLNPVSKRVRSLFTVSGAWRVQDAVPSPDGRSVALVEYGCSGDADRLLVRALATGRSHLVTARLSACGLESDVSWDPASRELVFAYGNPRNVDALPAGCELATAAADRASTPASWATIRLRSSCGFDSTAFDSQGIVAIVGCSDNDGGTTSTLRQYDGKRVVYHRALDSFDPPQYGLATQLESDPGAHTVLVSEIVSDDPDVSDVWTFNDRTLRQVNDYFGDAILAEP